MVSSSIDVFNSISGIHLPELPLLYSLISPINWLTDDSFKPSYSNNALIIIVIADFCSCLNFKLIPLNHRFRFLSQSDIHLKSRKKTISHLRLYLSFFGPKPGPLCENMALQHIH